MGATPPPAARAATTAATANAATCVNHSGDFLPATYVGTATPAPVSVYYYNGLGTRGQALAQQFVTALSNSTIFDDMRYLFNIPGSAVQVFIAPVNQKTDGSGGAYHYGCDFDETCGGGTIYLDADFDNQAADPVELLLGLFVAELSESFMGAQNAGWGCAYSNGEGLSRVLAEYETPTHTFDLFETGTQWATHFANWTDQTEFFDGDGESVGNAVVYVNWMRSLGYTLRQITQAGGQTLAANYKTLTGKTTAFADLKAALVSAPVRSDNPFPVDNLIWQNPSSGQLSTWQLKGSTVTGNQFLGSTCGSSGGCSTTWHPVDTIGDNTILWDNPNSGQLGVWSFNDGGAVTIPPFYSQTCGASNGCSAQWKPIGRVWTTPQCNPPFGSICPSSEGLAWYNAGTGQVEIWHMLGNTFQSASYVSAGCAGACAQAWQPVATADFDNNGNSDILWYNVGTGQLGAWLLDSAGNVINYQYMSWTCSQSSGCASAWRLVDVGDANGDGNVDLLWHNASTGVLQNWILDGFGNVTSNPSLSWTCDAASGCSSSWTALGYVQYP